MTDPDSELTRQERDALAQLPREAVSPPALEDATVEALLARGLLRRRTAARRRVVEIGLALAASALLFVGGLVVGRRQGASEPAGDAPQFVLLLYEGVEYRAAPPGQEDTRVREYAQWAGERAAQGELVTGEKLREEPDVVIGTDGAVRTAAAPAGEARLTGFFIIRAPDRGHALEIARSCPHVRYGGSIVLREIEPT